MDKLLIWLYMEGFIVTPHAAELARRGSGSVITMLGKSHTGNLAKPVETR